MGISKIYQSYTEQGPIPKWVEAEAEAQSENEGTTMWFILAIFKWTIIYQLAMLLLSMLATNDFIL